MGTQTDKIFTNNCPGALLLMLLNKLTDWLKLKKPKNLKNTY